MCLFNTRAPAVVVVLSAEFISKKYPMEELRLMRLLRQQGADSNNAKAVRVLPVLYDITYEAFWKVVEYYKAAIDVIAGVKEEEELPALPMNLSVVQHVVAAKVKAKESEMLKQWVDDLEGVCSITCLRRDQVRVHLYMTIQGEGAFVHDRPR
jgi:hypothetical protein